ncbi:MAG TPA: universal stress protein, partial [Actinomycetota bacterium]|nr:universal stress protein [Actinomycetota bacterium]
MAYRRIVLATDGSDSAETAEHVAATLARSTKGTVIVVHAFQRPELAEGAVDRARRIAEREGVRSEVVLGAGEPDRLILRTAEERAADVIVTGSRGLFRAEQLIGNIVRKVATHAPCDVLLTRARPEDRRPHEAPPYRHVLIATDGSATADRASRKGFALAKRLGAAATLVFVGHPKTGEMILADTLATMGDEGVPTQTVVADGDPAQAIMEAARQRECDLIVVGNRGLAGARGAILGSVPRDVAEYAECDVLIARTIAQSLEEIGPGEGGIVVTGDHKVAVYR